MAPDGRFWEGNQAAIGQATRTRWCADVAALRTSIGKLLAVGGCTSVIESWKGAKRGDLIKVRTRLDAEETTSVYMKVVQADTKKSEKVLTAAGIWLIYQNGPEPLQLSTCGPSVPIELGGANDFEILYRLKAESRESR